MVNSEEKNLNETIKTPENKSDGFDVEMAEEEAYEAVKDIDNTNEQIKELAGQSENPSEFNNEIVAIEKEAENAKEEFMQTGGYEEEQDKETDEEIIEALREIADTDPVAALDIIMEANPGAANELGELLNNEYENEQRENYRNQSEEGKNIEIQEAIERYMRETGTAEIDKDQITNKQNSLKQEESRLMEEAQKHHEEFEKWIEEGCQMDFTNIEDINKHFKILSKLFANEAEYMKNDYLNTDRETLFKDHIERKLYIEKLERASELFSKDVLSLTEEELEEIKDIGNWFKKFKMLAAGAALIYALSKVVPPLLALDAKILAAGAETGQAMSTALMAGAKGLFTGKMASFGLLVLLYMKVGEKNRDKFVEKLTGMKVPEKLRYKEKDDASKAKK